MAAATTSRDAAPWVWAAFVALLSHARAGVLEYVGVGVLLLSRAPVGVGAAAGVEAGAAAGVEDGVAGAGPSLPASLPVSLRLVPGAGVVAGVVTVRDGTVLPG